MNKISSAEYITKQIEGHRTTEKYALTTNYLKLMQWLHVKIPYGKILDLGCNTGYESLMIKKEGRDVIGIDIGPEYVEEARKRGLEAYIMDMHKLDKFNPESFDCVYANNVLEHSINPAVAFGEIYTVLKPNGVLIACLPSDYKNPDFYSEYWDSTLHVWKPTPQQLNNIVVEAGFKVLELMELDVKELFDLKNASSDNLYEILICQKREGRANDT